MAKIRDVRRVTIKEARRMAQMCDFLVPVVAAGGTGIVKPPSAQLTALPHVRTKKILYVCGSDTPKVFDPKNVLSKELGVALNAVGRRTFPVVVPIESHKLEEDADRDMSDEVAADIVFMPLSNPSKACFKTIRDAHRTTIASAPDVRVFWAHMLGVMRLGRVAPEMFVVEAGSAFRGGDQMAYYLDRMGARYALSLVVRKRDRRSSLTHDNLAEYAATKENKPGHKKVVSIKP